MTNLTQSLNPGALQRVMKETTALRKSPPSGFQLINNEDNPLDIIEVCLDGPGKQTSSTQLMGRTYAF